jgi:hypothetical protein
MTFDLASSPTRCHCGDWVATIIWRSAAGSTLQAVRHLDSPLRPTAAWHNHFAQDVPRRDWKDDLR